MNHIVVWSLMKEDFTEERVEEIEETIKAAIRVVIGSAVQDDLSFSFPSDPTVTSVEIPLAVDAVLVFDGEGCWRKALKRHIEAYVQKTVTAWRKVDRVKADVRFVPKDEA